MLYKYGFFISCLLMSAFKSSAIFTDKQTKPLPVIFETDMGNDIDDALALDMLYKFMDQGKVNIIAVCTNNDDVSEPGFVDVMNTWYGYPSILVGRVADGVRHTHTRSKNYAEVVYNARKKDGSLKYARIENKAEKLPDAVELYRKILTGQEDNSVIIISVSFSTNIGRLLDTPGDQYSSLTGNELVAKKEKLLSIMAGSFSPKALREFNVVNDILNATKVFEEWPGTIIATPFEIGLQVKYPAESIMNDFNWTNYHPMKEAYKAYRKMPYDRYPWDLIAVLNAVNPMEDFFAVSEKGKISVDEEGLTTFEILNEGKHTYLTATLVQAEKIKYYLIDLITRKPSVYTKQ
jgi:inosine-uridine nucleoside N-ribohydrolase